MIGGMYLKGADDTRCPRIIQAMRRNRFRKILSFFHLNNNDLDQSNDRYFKVRQVGLFDILNKLGYEADLLP